MREPELHRPGRTWPGSADLRRRALMECFRGDAETAGQIRFATVSGILTTRPEMIREVDRRLPPVLVITTKSYQVLPNPGNREPVIVEPSAGNFGNAVGLKNPGMERGVQELLALRRSHRMRALLNVSISGSTPEEFVQLAKGFSPVADTLELNFSCPHAAPGYGMSIGVDPELVYLYVKAIREATELPILPKLSPNVDDMGPIARAAVEAGADGLVAINTVGPELYIEPHSGKPMLMNSHGGKGGKSGLWIRETALHKVREIRVAVGPDIPIIGMGGVGDRSSARDMADAGADIVGIGSAFASHPPGEWNRWFSGMALPGPASEAGDAAADPVPAGITKRQMEYRPFTILKSEEGPGGLRRITLSGSARYESGQFAFLWIPGVGEKPFSVALAEPLTFLVRPRGEMTRALCRMEEGETLYLRGVYGAGAAIFPGSRAWILAGGTGLAVVPRLAEELQNAGCEVTVFMGLSDASGEAAGVSEEVFLEEEISRYGKYRIVPDRGKPGRAVEEFLKELSGSGRAEDAAVYTIGPFPFMDGVARGARREGVDPGKIQISIETPTRCGVGLCGECACAGRLTCREGTFFSLQELEERGVTILEWDDDH